VIQFRPAHHSGHHAHCGLQRLSQQRVVRGAGLWQPRLDVPGVGGFVVGQGEAAPVSRADAEGWSCRRAPLPFNLLYPYLFPPPEEGTRPFRVAVASVALDGSGHHDHNSSE